MGVLHTDATPKSVKENQLKHLGLFALLSAGLTVPALAKTHDFDYPMACSALWPAVKDTLRTSGKYGIIGIDNGEMTASYNIGGALTGKRTNSLVLNTKGAGCDLQVQTSYSGLTNNDAADLKKRIDESLTKLQSGQPAKSDLPPAPAN